MQTTLRRHAAIFSFLIGLTMASASAANFDRDLPNLQKVNDHVYRGAQPTERGFQELAKQGIKTVIDLRDIGEHSQADEQRYVTASGMRYISIPMHGLSTPDDKKVAEVESIFNDPSSGPVFVHCKRGADRTGMVVAVYRISHDHWENKNALREAKSYGMSFFERSIQRYVRDYKPAVTLAATEAGSPTATDPSAPANPALTTKETSTVR